jgi:putative spermidine/putrescine transport system permease protein
VTHVLVILPFVIAMVSASLANFDWTLQEAAMDLGAGPIRTFFRVILPQISLSLAIAGLFAFITSFDQVETTIFMVRTGSNTLPVEMFLYLQKWQDPTIAALVLAADPVRDPAGSRAQPDGARPTASFIPQRSGEST